MSSSSCPAGNPLPHSTTPEKRDLSSEAIPEKAQHSDVPSLEQHQEPEASKTPESEKKSL